MFVLSQFTVIALFFAGLIFFFNKIIKRPALVIAVLCFVLVCVSVIAQGIFLSIPIPADTIPLKLLRLIVFVLLIAVLMVMPLIIAIKYKFDKLDSFFKLGIKNIQKAAAEIYHCYKAECILCLISILVSYFSFFYMDIHSLAAWSIETMDAIFRGGFSGYTEILEQNLWGGYHGVSDVSFSINNFIWGLWNLPTLFIHYIFNTDCEMTPLVMMWAKIYLEIFEILTAYICCKIVKEISGSKRRAMLTFILVIGSASAFWCVGYSCQDDIFYMFLLTLGVYYTIIGKKNRGLIFMSLALYECPMMFIFTTILIISSSYKLKEIFIKLLISLLPIFLSMNLIIGERGSYYTNFVFKLSLIPTGLYDNASIFAIVLVIVLLSQFFIKRKEKNNQIEYMVYSLCVTSVAFYLFSYTNCQRYQIFSIFIIICIMTIKNQKEMITGIAGLCIFEYGFFVLLTKVHNNYFNFKWMNTWLQNAFNGERLPNVSLYNYIKYSFPEIANYWEIIHGAVFAAGIWILYICYPKRKSSGENEIKSLIPIKFLTKAFVSSSLILTFVMYLFAVRMSYFNSGYSKQSSEAINGTNYVEEYYRGKSASWIRVSFKPLTNGIKYPNSQTLQMDIVDSDSNEIIGTTSCTADKLENNKTYVFQVDDIKMEKDKWYILRFSSPAIIENEDNYMYLFCTKDGSANSERHFAVSKSDDNEASEVNYDIVGEVLTG